MSLMSQPARLVRWFGRQATLVGRAYAASLEAERAEIDRRRILDILDGR